MAQGLNNNWQNLKWNATDFINTNILWANYAAQWNNADFWEQDLWNNNTRNINNWNINQLWDDNLVANTVIAQFAEKFNCDLTMLKGGEHWFHTPQQLDILYGWIQNSFQTSQERFRTDRFL